ncbi:MAG: hypothetical protein IKB80_05215 [Oscillospiraceae bacterium]|nr:hypothetical protein [Oscillospiraceae bacterium]
MDEKERQEFDLEDILKEFGITPEPEEESEYLREDLPWKMPAREERENNEETVTIDLATLQKALDQEPKTSEQTVVIDLEEIHNAVTQEQEALEQTRRMEPVTEETPADKSDTIRLDGLKKRLADRAEKEGTVEETQGILRTWSPENTVHAEPFSSDWEPEYEQPMGEYVPPAPFKPRSRFQELKRKLIEGPEKRYYELTEQGGGKLQIAIFLSLLVVLICAVSTVMYALGLVQENRMRLMVFGQFLAMLVSALLASFQLIEGIADLSKKKFTLNTLLAFTFFVCLADGLVCLMQVRVPCCAAFSLEVTMSLWSAYQRRYRERSQLDTMRKATRLDGLAACPDYLEGQKGLLRKEGQVEDFMDRYEEVGPWEKRLNTYSLIAVIAAFVVGIGAGVWEGLSAGVWEALAVGVQVTAVSLLAAVPATAFICQSRPACMLESRLHKLGTVLCGWQGIDGLAGKAVFPLTYSDLYPAGTVRLNGVKYFGSREPDQVVAYAAAVIAADKGGLEGLFAQVLDDYNGRHYDAYDLCHFDNGGLQGMVEGETVLIGSASFMQDMQVEIPENARLSYAVYVAIETELCGLFAVSYEKSQSVAAALTTLNAYRGLTCALTSDDFMLTQGFLRGKFGIKSKRFLLPEYPVRQELRQKEPEADAPVLMMTTALGLAPYAFGVTGARVLKSASRLGALLHMIGGVVGLAIMVLLVVLGALQLLTPANMFLYQLVWMIPAFLITEWTRSI